MPDVVGHLRRTPARSAARQAIEGLRSGPESSGLAGSRPDQAAGKALPELGAKQTDDLGALLELLPDAAILVDEHGGIVQHNSLATGLFGAGADGLRPRAIVELIKGLDQPYRAERPPEANAPGEPPELLELLGARLDGTHVALEVGISAFERAGKGYELLVLRDVSARKEKEQRRMSRTAQLVAINAELSTLYEISSTVNRTLELESMLHEVLRTVTQLGGLRVQPRGSVFLVEGDRMLLASSVGQPEDFAQQHQSMRVGDCLCGRVAASGEVIVTQGAATADCDHRFYCNGRGDHGHVIVPLRANERVVGVLCLYLVPGAEVDLMTVRTLMTAGNHIGIAIENARLYEASRQRALHDPLTGLANRRLTEIFLERHLARSRRSGAPFSVIMIDVDHFKRYNDTHGHAAGDALLVSTARAIQDVIREADLAARYGGEEFLILLPDTSVRKAAEVAERIRRRVAKQTGVTISLGVAFSRSAAQTGDALIREADDTMYRAKRAGRNRVEVSAVSEPPA